MLPILRTLLAAGADPGASGENGQSAADLADEFAYPQIAALLRVA